MNASSLQCQYHPCKKYLSILGFIARAMSSVVILIVSQQQFDLQCAFSVFYIFNLYCNTNDYIIWISHLYALYMFLLLSGINFFIFFKNSHQRCFVKKIVLKNFARFAGKRLCRSRMFNKVADRRLPTLLKIRTHSNDCFYCFLACFQTGDKTQHRSNIYKCLNSETKSIRGVL